MQSHPSPGPSQAVHRARHGLSWRQTNSSYIPFRQEQYTYCPQNGLPPQPHFPSTEKCNRSCCRPSPRPPTCTPARKQTHPAASEDRSKTNSYSYMTVLFLFKPFPEILETGLLAEHKNTDLIDLSRSPSACNKCCHKQSY